MRKQKHAISNVRLDSIDGRPILIRSDTKTIHEVPTSYTARFMMNTVEFKVKSNKKCDKRGSEAPHTLYDSIVRKQKSQVPKYNDTDFFDDHLDSIFIFGYRQHARISERGQQNSLANGHNGAVFQAFLS